MSSDGHRVTVSPFAQKRDPAPMLGVAVVEALVDAIVSGELQPGEHLPPEGLLSAQFGVSRTVIRESVKRIQEKGLVTIVRGRGTSVAPVRSWNVLDQVVLTSLIKHDDTFGVLDELSVVRAQLESVMAAGTAERRSEAQLRQLRGHLQRMRDSLEDEATFRAADVDFHEVVMSASGNRLAESIARTLFDRALESSRYRGIDPADNFRVTLAEHEAVFTAIATQDAAMAQQTMQRHIIDAWQRRRLPTHLPQQY
ncbi:FadR/GntR family transcriptional regulator [Ornithinicoccus halotolerans]|uniref:FadR/GntR family transcriptional regulator n=1 Tax=Ornithinicoccus halotolerans TaxID=1748220 RepID=UPI001297E73B|nr:FadR/GntR family transcriptional regulator [Ornithinicoccus halotolerans]